MGFSALQMEPFYFLNSAENAKNFRFLCGKNDQNSQRLERQARIKKRGGQTVSEFAISCDIFLDDRKGTIMLLKNHDSKSQQFKELLHLYFVLSNIF